MITDDLAMLMTQAIFAARDAGEFVLADEQVTVKLETPANKQHGDYSSNIALTLKKSTGIPNSRDIADRILKHLPVGNSLLDRVEVAGPGFMNFYLKPTWLQDVLLQIETEANCYGTTNERNGETVLIEFVSANPTGPISVVNGRAAALGDVLGNLLAAQGAQVGREFYINDALNSLQIEKFAESCYARYMQQLGHAVLFPPDKEGDCETREEASATPMSAGNDGKDAPPVPFPKDGYRGDYVKDIARQIVAEVGAKYENDDSDARIAFFREETPRRMIAAQQNALEAFGIHFDRWYYESSLYQSGEVEATIKSLTDKGYTYPKEGALWLRSSAFGDEKDRVLVRSNEKATYIAADAAYHHNKFQRGNSRLINIWGADHHGYVARLKAGVAALGYEPATLEIILTQMVSLVRDGEVVIGGKRAGNIIELKEDLIDEIGRDAARFYFLLNSYETPATVDVELAKKQSNDNPVYYVQYAHARLCSILRKGKDEKEITLLPASEVDRSLLTHAAELDVLRKLTDYPGDVKTAADRHAPHRLTRYAMDLAALLNIFYENCQVLPSSVNPGEPALTLARLSLVNSARIVLHNLLTLLGITAPEQM